MSLGDDIVILETTSTEVKNRILKSHELLRAIDTGALYIGGKDGKPQALIASSTSSGGRVEAAEMGIATQSGTLLLEQPDGGEVPVVSMPRVQSSPASLIPTASLSFVTRDVPFGGWGAQWLTLPDMRISHILLPRLAQSPASASNRWSRIDVKVRAGDRTGAVVGQGSLFVGGYVNLINDQYVRLYDAAGNPKVVTSADLGPTYWLEYIAYNKDGAVCPVGEMLGSRASNYVSLSTAYFLTTTQLWQTTVSDTYPLAIQPAYWSAQTVVPWESSAAIDLVLPPIYGVVGRELNVYFDGLSSLDYRRVDWDVAYTGAGTGIAQQSERWTVTPDVAGTFALTVSALDPLTGATIAQASTTVYIAAAGAAVTATLLAIGDSTTANGIPTGEIVTLDTADSAAAVTLTGTKGTSPNLYEATAGWSTATFTTAGSPFFVGGVLNATAYVANNSLGAPTHAVINLGINDCFGATSDAAAMLAARTAVANIAKLVTMLQVAYPTLKVAVACTTPGSASQDAFGKNYGTGQIMRRYRRNIAILWRQVLDAFGGQASRLLWVLPYNVSVDTERNMSTETVPANSRNSATVTRQSNGVHPADTGYKQVADVLWAWLKYVG